MAGLSILALLSPLLYTIPTKRASSACVSEFLTGDEGKFGFASLCVIDEVTEAYLLVTMIQLMETASALV